VVEVRDAAAARTLLSAAQVDYAELGKAIAEPSLRIEARQVALAELVADWSRWSNHFAPGE